MSEWSYIYVAYGLTWTTLAVYALYLRARRRQVEASALTVHGHRRDA